MGPTYAIFNGPATFISLVETARRPHEISLDLPAAWPHSVTSLETIPGRSTPHHYRAPDYDLFADSPIIAGTIAVTRFTVDTGTYELADFGDDRGAWDATVSAAAIKRIIEEHHHMLRGLPFSRYVFLNAFRRGGGLEHTNSSLLTSSAATSPTPGVRWLNYVSHEFFHAINIKRLRPVELGPFDYDSPPVSPSLWLSEGVTTYYGDLAVVRSGLATPEEYLRGLSSLIRSVQLRPGRLVQTLERSSLDVTKGGGSGIGGSRETTTSYYEKGAVVGMLLDAHIRRLTNGGQSFDEVMRRAYRQYGGARGFTPPEFEAIASAVAGTNLTPWFDHAIRSTGELDYTEFLTWYGLRFTAPNEANDHIARWLLEVRPDATPAQREHLAALLRSARITN